MSETEIAEASFATKTRCVILIGGTIVSLLGFAFNGTPGLGFGIVGLLWAAWAMLDATAAENRKEEP